MCLSFGDKFNFIFWSSLLVSVKELVWGVYNLEIDDLQIKVLFPKVSKGVEGVGA